MTQDEIVAMARDSGMELYGLGKNRARFVYHLEAFANLVAAKEREACAKIVEDSPSYDWHKFACEAAAAIKEALAQRTEQNFCSRCGKRLGGIDSIHTCTPPMEMNT